MRIENASGQKKKRQVRQRSAENWWRERPMSALGLARGCKQERAMDVIKTGKGPYSFERPRVQPETRNGKKGGSRNRTLKMGSPNTARKRFGGKKPPKRKKKLGPGQGGGTDPRRGEGGKLSPRRFRPLANRKTTDLRPGEKSYGAQAKF